MYVPGGVGLAYTAMPTPGTLVMDSSGNAHVVVADSTTGRLHLNDTNNTLIEINGLSNIIYVNDAGVKIIGNKENILHKTFTAGFPIFNVDNKNKPFGRVILETGKIVTAGLSAAGAIVLGEVIEKGLMAVPVFAFEIPILGSLASLIGLFMGGLIAGIVGAIAINLIDKIVINQRRAEANKGLIEQGNIVLGTQAERIDLNQEKLKQG